MSVPRIVAGELHELAVSCCQEQDDIPCCLRLLCLDRVSVCMQELIKVGVMHTTSPTRAQRQDGTVPSVLDLMHQTQLQQVMERWQLFAAFAGIV